MANLNGSKKLLIRVALVSGSTVATLIGAQSVAMFDQNAQVTQRLAPATPVEVTLPPTAVPIPTVEIIHQAPSIVLLRPQRPSGLSNVRPAASNPTNTVPNRPAIVPPNPQAVSAPAPVIVHQQQQQAPAVSHSSR